MAKGFDLRAGVSNLPCILPAPLPLAVRELGGEGPPVLVLHGLLGSSRNWQSAGAEMAARGFRVTAADLRNHGLSPWDDDCSYAALAGDVAALIGRAFSGPVHLIGHSMGGKAAMRLVMDRPELVSRLTVVDIAPRAYPDRLRTEFIAMESLDLAAVTSRKDADARLAATVTDWGLRQFILTNLGQDPDGRWRWTVNRAALTRSLPEILGNPLAPGEAWSGRTRFIRGGKSHYVRDDDFAAVRAHFPSADVVTLPESGHNPHFDARAGFVDAALG
ncbi:MAG: alpha/beta fold hydrolase [Opitutales bacterium]